MARHPSWRLFGQIASRFDKEVLFYDTFVFFKRTFNPVHVIAVSIGHGGYDPVIAMSLRAKKQIRNPSHHFTNAKSAHRCLPPNDVRHLSGSIGTETKKDHQTFQIEPGFAAKRVRRETKRWVPLWSIAFFGQPVAASVNTGYTRVVTAKPCLLIFEDIAVRMKAARR